MDEFSNVGNALLGILPADKVVGVKPLQKRGDRRRREDGRGQLKWTASEEEELIYHRAEGPLHSEPGEGTDGSTTDPVESEDDSSDRMPGPRKVDVVV